MLDGIRSCLKTLISGVKTEDEQRFVEASEGNSANFQLLSQIFPRARMIQVVQDPREYIAKLGARDPSSINQGLHQWQADLEEVRTKCAENADRYMEVSLQLLCENPKESLARMLAFLGEPWDESLFDSFKNADYPQTWKSELSTDNVACIEDNVGSLMEEMGFHLSETLAN